MRTLTLFLLLLLSYNTYADNDIERKNYNWDENPVLTPISLPDTNISVYYLKNFISREFYYVDDNLMEFYLVHKKIKLLTHEGINYFNKVYLPIYDKDDILIEKARVINSKGQVIELKNENIKEGVDEDTDAKYRYFAFDGVDINSEIEYIYLYKTNPRIKGSLLDVQTKFPQINFSFELISPLGLIFEFKSYNDLPNIMSDTSLQTQKEKNRWELIMDTVKYMPNQRNSAYDAEIMYFGYKLTKNLYRNLADLYSYGELAQLVYKAVYANVSKNDMKFLKKILKEIPLKNLDEEQKIRAVEDFVKSNLTIGDFSYPSDTELSVLWGLKIANEFSVTVIIANLIKMLDIDVEVGLTCDRFLYKFDPDFELWTYPDEYMLYFSGIKKFTSLSNDYRLNFPDYNFIFNHGLFVKTVKIKNEEYGVGNIRFIPQNDYKTTGDTLKIFADLAKYGFNDVTYDFYHSVCGYNGEFYQTVYERVKDAETKKELEESLIKHIDEDGEIEDLKLFNFDSKSFGVKPAIVTAKLTTNSFFEKAQHNHLFKIGELIGPQMEFYKTEKRILNVEDYYTRHYYRLIKFNIPEGYKVTNLDDLIIDKTYKNKEKNDIMVFKSSYKVDNNEVEVLIEEYYSKIFHPVEMYEDYRRVINAAADFNKVVLVFTKN